jgi:hypothetical protein
MPWSVRPSGVCAPACRHASTPGTRSRRYSAPGTSRPDHSPCPAHQSRRTSLNISREVRRRFFRISHSCFSRMFPACSRLSLPASPASNALTQLRSVCSISPKFFATAPADWRALTRLIASSFNSIVYACFGIFITLFSKASHILHHPWKTNFRGKAHW